MQNFGGRTQKVFVTGQLEIGAVLHLSWCRVSFSGVSSKDARSMVVLQDAASSTNVLP